MTPIDWHGMLVPTMSPFELVIRGTVMYLGMLVALRVFRREAGSLSPADLLLLVLIADAAQNAMAGEYHSLTEGVVLVATIYLWNYFLDWLAFRSPRFRRLMTPEPLPLIVDGALNRRNMRSELLTLSDLKEQLREQGIDDLMEVKRCYLEGDGNLSVIRRSGEQNRTATLHAAVGG